MAKILNPSAAVMPLSKVGSAGAETMRASTSGPAWDEQIVPTLRKRLEAESQYLSHRLSGSSSHVNHNFVDSSTPSQNTSYAYDTSQPASYHPVRDFESATQGWPTALPPSRTRTKSTPFASSAPSSSSKPPIPKSTVAKTPSRNPPSRIPISRSRSGSSAGGSSSSHHYSSPPLGNSPQSTSGIPIPVSRIRSHTRQPSIDSIDLKAAEDGGRIQDERPPFLLTQPSRDFDEERSVGRWELDTREALDIAHKGHSIAGAKRGRQSLGGDGTSRQRADTLKVLGDSGSRLERSSQTRNMSSSSSFSSSALPRTSIDVGSRSRNGQSGIPRASTSGLIGLGQPSTPSIKSQSRVASSGSKLRTRPGANTTPTSTNSLSQSQRSASLNMLSSSTSTPPSQRLGIAAHFKPPESDFTPPRGTDWDDVVLPAVAKKMGTPKIGSPSTVIGDEESFVVEWDRDGKPLKWQKGKMIRDKDGNVSVTPTANTIFDYDPSLPRPSPASSAFSPTFEMSPDNPFPSTPTRNSALKSGIELGPITTSKYGPVSPGPSSPAPFDSYKSSSDSPQHSLSKADSTNRSVTRKPSFLKSMTSADDIKRPHNARNDSRTQPPPTIEIEPATSARGHFPQHSTFPPPEKWQPQAGTHATSSKNRKDDEIKKGRCCTIM